MLHLVAVVDANAQHRNMVAEALLPFYTVQAYDTPANAISGMLIARPRLILVGQRVGAGSGINFIKDLRKEISLSVIPVIFIIDSGDYRNIDLTREFGIKDYLVKPYRRSELISAISKQLDARVEHSWQELPAVQRKALEGTLGVFNSVADDISNGNPLSYKSINESCAALVDVVTQEELTPLLNKIKDHDNFTYVHSLRFAIFMALFGKSVGLPKTQQTVVATGGLLHDVGMMTVPRDLLGKHGKLAAEEWSVLRGHVAISQKILVNTDSIPKGVLTIGTQDHERLDGSGYPRGLKSSELNDLARMAGIIDVFCALTDRRPYKRAIPAHVALETMAIEMKDQLDQGMLVKFKEILLDTAFSGKQPGQE
jgi:HD-GYP domain-containing protein (c-di-GMP phosphodiesterase class II)